MSRIPQTDLAEGHGSREADEEVVWVAGSLPPQQKAPQQMPLSRSRTSHTL